MQDNIRVGLTQGDPNGVGYEVILKALAEEEITELFTPIIFGYRVFSEKAKEKFGLQEIKLHYIKDYKDIEEGKINLIELNGEPPSLSPGEITKEAGESAVKALEESVVALKKGYIDVLVTAPFSKEAVQSDTFKFPGHTEFLSERIGNGEEAMMILCNEDLRVALLTKHIPITQVPENISEDKIINAVKKFSNILKRDYGIIRPSIAVLSLNPHAGDGGLIGEEENTIIKPAINRLIDEGFLTFGPFPADGFFGHSLYKKFDGVLAMYHDQGLAPFKTIVSSGGVNYSGNLPYVRTSPDHGTAFDIAWKGEADPSSLRDAIYMAIDIYKKRNAYDIAAFNPLKKYVHERPERLERNHNKSDNNQEIDD